MQSQNFIYAFGLVLCGIGGVLSATLPADITKCKVADANCIAEKINEILQKYPTGNNDFALTNVAKLNVPRIHIAHDTENAPVQLTFDLTDNLITGLEKAKVHSIKGFDENPKEIVAKLTVPELRLKGKYVVDGKILLLPIRGKGNSELILKDCEIVTKHSVEMESRNGKNHLKITKVDVTLQPKGFSIILDNLFDGDKELTESMTKTINDNWQLIWEDLKPDISSAVADILRNIVAPIYDALPYDDFYTK